MKKFSLVGVDGNAYSIMGYVSSAMRQVGLGSEKDNYIKEATSGDYNNLLCVSLKWLDKCNEKLGIEDEDDEE